MTLFNLTFLAPLALLGLLALAVPIYLHLRHKPRAERYAFSAIEFLLRAEKKRKRRFHAEQLWLMLFRLAIICLLAFLFAKPFVEDSFGSGLATNHQPVLFILDNTPSMWAGPANARFFDEARNQIDDLASRLGSESPARLLLASQPTRHAEATTAAAVRAVLAETKVTTVHHTLDAAYAEAKNLTATAGWEQVTVHIFTDGSRTAWKELPGSKPEGLEIVYHAMRSELPNFHNLGITQVSQPPGDVNSVEVSIHNSSPTAQDADLALIGGESPVRFPMRVPAHNSSAHYFALPQPVPTQLEVSLADDDFDVDNTMLVVPKANRQVKVLIVDGDTHPESVNDESFFLKTALGFEEAEKYGFTFQVVTPHGFQAAAIDSFDVFFILNVDLPPTQLMQQILAKGKGLCVSMGERLDHEAWNGFLRTLNLEMWEVKSLSPAQALELREPDFPMFASMDQDQWHAYLDAVGISKFRLVSTGRSNAKIPLALGDGSPLLLALNPNPGRMLIWTSSMDVDWTNFPIEFGFVPFARQACSYLANLDASTDVSSLTVSEVVARGLVDKLTLKTTTPVLEGLAHEGPKPGIYTLSENEQVSFVQVRLDPQELDFRDLGAETDGSQTAETLAGIGFQAAVRTDLAPSVQWLLFLLLLVETLVAARTTLSWGAR